jgi:hypothetical protein
VTIEIRHIVFAAEETRTAVISFADKHNRVRQEDIKAIEIVGDNEAPVVIVRLRPDRQMDIPAADLKALLLMYCRDHRIPIPQRSLKKVERSHGGLKLVLTIGQLANNAPMVIDNNVVYRDMDLARQVATFKQELEQSALRIKQAELDTAEAKTGRDLARRACEKAQAELAAIVGMSGLRGRIGRLLASPKKAV